MLAEIGTPSAAAGARSRRQDTTIVWGVAAVAVLVLVHVGLAGNLGADWVNEARPSVVALLHDRFGLFLRAAPAYGGSLLLRAPFLELTRMWRAGPDAVYAAGALPCVAALAALALWLSHRLAARGGGLLAQVTVVALCIANPITISALELGHPEELLGAALCAAAVLCAIEDRAVLAGALAGLATANKAWGVLAAGPVLVALSVHRPRALAAMCLTGGAVMAPFLLVRSGGAAAQVNAAGGAAGGLFSPLQLWWFLGHHVAGTIPGTRVQPRWLGPLGHTLPVAVMAPLTLAFWALRRRAPGWQRSDALLLLALLLLLRCALDPWNTNYYAAPFLTALIAWECSAHERPPILTLAAALVSWFALEGSIDALGNAHDALALIYMLAAVTGIVAIGAGLRVPRGRGQTAETSSSSATRNDDPQPQAATTLGLSTLKPAP